MCIGTLTVDLIFLPTLGKSTFCMSFKCQVLHSQPRVATGQTDKVSRTRPSRVVVIVWTRLLIPASFRLCLPLTCQPLIQW